MVFKSKVLPLSVLAGLLVSLVFCFSTGLGARAAFAVQPVSHGVLVMEGESSAASTNATSSDAATSSSSGDAATSADSATDSASLGTAESEQCVDSQDIDASGLRESGWTVKVNGTEIEGHMQVALDDVIEMTKPGGETVSLTGKDFGINSTQCQEETETTAESTTTDTKTSSSQGWIIGISLAAAAVIVLAVVLAVVIRIRKRRRA